MKDFTEEFADSSSVREFRVGDDVFRVAPTIPTGAAMLLARMSKMSEVDQLIAVGDFLDMVILPESAERFATRLRDPVNPITPKHLSAIIHWLLEEYGARPTPLPSPSPSAQPSTGMNSTAGLLPTG